MKTGVVAIIGLLVVCSCVICGTVALVFMTGAGSPTKGQKAPYDGLPTTPPPVPAFFGRTAVRQARWNRSMRSIFSVRSDCWHVNHFFRVTMVNELLRLAQEAEAQRAGAVSDAEAERRYTQIMLGLIAKLGSELDNCPRNTSVTLLDRDMTVTVGDLMDGRVKPLIE